MPVNTAFQRALKLAREGKLEEAQSLLLTIDSPEAERLLAKVNGAIAARGASQQLKNVQVEKPKVEAKLETTKPKKKQNPVTLGLLFVAVIAMAGLSAFYYQVVHLSALAQAAGIGAPEGSVEFNESLLEGVFEGRLDIDTVQIIESEDGTTDVLVAYFWSVSRDGDSYGYGEVVGVVGGAAMTQEWDYDEIIAFPTSRNGDVLEVMAVKLEDAIDYLNGDLTVEEMIERMHRVEMD